MKPTRKHTPKFYIHHGLCHGIKLSSRDVKTAELEVIIALAGLRQFPHLISHSQASAATYIVFIDLWADGINQPMYDLTNELKPYYPALDVRRWSITPAAIHDGTYGFTLKDLQKVIKNA